MEVLRLAVRALARSARNSQRLEPAETGYLPDISIRN